MTKRGMAGASGLIGASVRDRVEGAWPPRREGASDKGKYRHHPNKFSLIKIST